MGELVERAGNDYDRWIEQVENTGYCVKPIRLIGRTEQVDSDTGEVRVAFESKKEPDGSLLIACGDRRESRCPSCAALYRGDAFQIVASGLAGGKGVPEAVADHPSLFVTFTAPSFGAVHAHRARGQATLPCRPRRSGKCRHGLPLACWHRHDETMPGSASRFASVVSTMRARCFGMLMRRSCGGGRRSRFGEPLRMRPASVRERSTRSCAFHTSEWPSTSGAALSISMS